MANLATIILDRMGVEGLKLVCCIFKEEKRGKVMILNNVPSAIGKRTWKGLFKCVNNARAFRTLVPNAY